jgi:hypothetical protein
MTTRPGTHPEADLGFPRIRATVAPAPTTRTLGLNTDATNRVVRCLW